MTWVETKGVWQGKPAWIGWPIYEKPDWRSYVPAFVSGLPEEK